MTQCSPLRTDKFRYRVRFGKSGPLKFTSHLDIQRVWERTLRRAKADVVFSEGFHPRPRLQFGPPLPLGYTSDCELIEFSLAKRVAPEDLLETLQQASAPGMAIHDVTVPKPAEPSVAKCIRSASYVVALPQTVDLDEMERKVTHLLASETCIRERRGKQYDLRPLILTLEVNRSRQGGQLEMELAASGSGTGRADEVVLALDLDPNRCGIHRSQLT